MDVKEVTYRNPMKDGVDEHWNIYCRELLKYAFECFMKGEYHIVSKEYMLKNEETEQFEFILKISYVDEKYINLFKNDGWLIYNFSDWKFKDWIAVGCIQSDRIDEYLKIFESKNLV